MEKLDSNTFDELLREQNPFQHSNPQFDLKGIQFISPSAMVQLAAASHVLAHRGGPPAILIDDPSVRTYLARAGFVSAIEDIAEVLPPMPGYLFDYRRGTNPMLLEVTRVESGAALPDLLDQVIWVLRHRLKYPKFDAYDVVTGISEVAQNTFDHNTSACGFMAMQVYGRGGSRFLEIGIADSGCGLAETLRRNPKNGNISSDADAIRQAVLLGTSEHDDPTRGTGLHHLLDITYKHSGSVQIRSGSAKVRYRMDKEQGWLFHVTPMPGVQIALTLPAKKSA
jgi:hypothetical protein